MWDPGQYSRFANERSRPFFELLGRVGAQDPSLVADLGCGPGELTAALARKWPGADVLGIDNSAQMIEAASALLRPGPADHPAGQDPGGRLRFALGDLRDWQPDWPLDVIVSNAALQWVPDHLQVLARWPGFLAAGGWLAIQVPGNFDQPSHLILRDMARSQRWHRRLPTAELNRQAGDPADYLDLLATAGCEVDAWETTYLHILHGDDPVLDWYSGTGLRPVIAALGPAQAEEFRAEYGARVREAYPAAPHGTVLPFRRVFAVAVRR